MQGFYLYWKLVLATFENRPERLELLPLVGLFVGVPLRLCEVVSVLLVLAMLIMSSYHKIKETIMFTFTTFQMHENYNQKFTFSSPDSNAWSILDELFSISIILQTQHKFYWEFQTILFVRHNFA